MLQASGVAARAKGTSGRPGGEPPREGQEGEEEIWLGLGGGACGQGQQLRETGFRSKRRWGEGAGGGGLPPHLTPSPAWSPGCPQAVRPGMGSPGTQGRPQGVLALVPGFPV